jgi:competence protein ComEA
VFDSLRRRAGRERGASARLKALAADPPGAGDQEWIDESDPPPAPASRLREAVGRWLPGRRLPMVLSAVLVAAGCAVIGVLISRPHPESPPVLPAAADAGSPRAAPGIVVSVVGKVARPGLVTLPEGARVADAVLAAGGVSDVDAMGLNMARRLADGEQVYVGVPAPPEVQAPAPGRPAKLDLNSAGPSQLDDLPGVGEVTAQRIVDWRAQHGRFTAVEQLRQVDGIGATRFARLKDLVTVR